MPDEGEIDHEATIPDEDMVISLTSTGYVKRVPLDEYRPQRRGGRGRMGMRTKEDDWIAHLFVASAHDWVLFFTSRGRFYRVKAWELPLANLQARGRPIVNFLPLEEGERVMSVFRTRDFTEGRYLVMGTRQGVVKKTDFSAYASRAARNAIAIRDDDELVDVRLADDDDQILLVSRNRMAARFPASEIRATGRDTMGVIGMRLDPDDAVIAIRVPREDADILVITADGVGKRTPFAEYRLTHRGARGVLTMARDGKGGTLVGALAVAEGDHVMLITEGGIITRMAVDEIRVIGRTTQGVIIQRVPEGDQIAAVALVPEADEAEADAADAAVTSLDEALAEPRGLRGRPVRRAGRRAARGRRGRRRRRRVAGGGRGGDRRVARPGARRSPSPTRSDGRSQPAQPGALGRARRPARARRRPLLRPARADRGALRPGRPRAGRRRAGGGRRRRARRHAPAVPPGVRRDRAGAPRGSGDGCRLLAGRARPRRRAGAALRRGAGARGGGLAAPAARAARPLRRRLRHHRRARLDRRPRRLDGLGGGSLRPGGRLVLVELHPLYLAVGSVDPLVLDFPYADAGPQRFDDPGSYAAPGFDTEANVTIEWAHSIGEVVTAALGAGLTVVALGEHLDAHSSFRSDLLPGPDEDGRYRLRIAGQPLPLLYSLVAERPASASR